MVHFKVHQSHDALESTANSDKADRVRIILILTKHVQYLFLSLITLFRVHNTIVVVLNYH